MDMLRESLPFLLGLVLPALVIVLVYFLHLERFKVPASFVVALIVGSCVSFFMGELSHGVEDGIMAIIIDTSLVFTGSQLTYHLIWKQLLELRLSRQSTPLARSSQR